MTDLRTLLRRFGLTQKEAADLLDMEDRSSIKRRVAWGKPDVAHQIDPRHVTWLLTAVAEIQARTGETAETIIRRVKVGGLMPIETIPTDVDELLLWDRTTGMRRATWHGEWAVPGWGDDRGCRISTATHWANLGDDE